MFVYGAIKQPNKCVVDDGEQPVGICEQMQDSEIMMLMWWWWLPRLPQHRLMVERL